MIEFLHLPIGTSAISSSSTSREERKAGSGRQSSTGSGVPAPKHGFKFTLREAGQIGYKFPLIVESETAPNTKVEIDIELC